MANITKALLIKYLDNNCTPDEAAIVEAYLRQPGSGDVLNLLLEERLEKDMEESMEATADRSLQQQWVTAMHTRMGRSGPSRPMRKWYYMAAAASLLMIAAISGLFHTGQRKQASIAMSVQQNKAGQRKVIQLSDGSTIYLGAASRLQYPEQLTGQTREISLAGEAFFDIVTDPAHPFIIHTGDVATTVLGTSFKIEAFEGQPVTVAVATGKVKVAAQTNGQIKELAVLTSGKQVSWDHRQAALDNVNAGDVATWHKGRLVFNNQSLQEIAAALERWYDVQISFDKAQKAKEKVTVTLFAASNLNTTLQTLAAGNNFSYTVKGRQVSIH
ncbi:FecR family protein [Chitinophaga terrae (ex Kim and Jung 2007)]|uniref:FecR family protein n=1 Tax=Chitinophaga terrae (ex Kim and Jung 2007) TaxID=408074 RepID=A0A1H4EHA3_9BACT|nr:FecR domain-containing protein [Chitinophaga terrae (ex Kim and Jung 2007)]GEP91654.1 anti-sigma factor [Chitinophaga terrae (ex Kim and Jung 2007)]SEA84461.1 FecR family protein [Chitinophaga terrae (ex Kim and Jung 2007)]